MPVLGLVVDFHGAAVADRARTTSWIAREPALTPGEPQDRRLPVVLEVDTKRDVDAWLDRLRDAQGVQTVEVVYVDFEDLLADGEPARDATRAGADGETRWS